jgi:hypothetical protein
MILEFSISIIQRKTAEAVGDFRKTPIYIVGMYFSCALPIASSSQFRLEV